MYVACSIIQSANQYFRISACMHREREFSARETLPKNVEQSTHPLSSSREYSFGKAAAGVYYT